MLKLIQDDTLNKWASDNLLQAPISLKEKLSWRMNEFSFEIKKIFYNNPLVVEFPEYAKKMRNILSHGRNKETSQGAELHYNFFIARIILAACILKTLEIEEIDQRILHFDEFNRNLYELDLVGKKANKQ